jgi:hypothetical protein
MSYLDTEPLPCCAPQMQEQMRNMKPEQLAAMGKQMGVQMTPEMASAAISASATTDFAQVAAMADASGSMSDMDPSSVAQAAKVSAHTGAGALEEASGHEADECWPCSAAPVWQCAISQFAPVLRR